MENLARNFKNTLYLEDQKRFEKTTYPIKVFLNSAWNCLMEANTGLVLDYNLSKRPPTAIDLSPKHIKKWYFCDVKRVYFVMMNDELMEECKARFKKCERRSYPKKYEAEFILSDVIEIGFSISEKVDLVTCQRLFNKAFESKEKAYTLANSISKGLKENGILVISIFKGEMIKERLENSESKKGFGNNCYKIETKSEISQPCPDYGVGFMMKLGEKCLEEYLVKSNVLIDLLQSLDMIMVENYSYVQLRDKCMKCPSTLRMMLRIGALYVDETTYKHCSTMTEEQEEVTKLYQWIVFQKKPSVAED